MKNLVAVFIFLVVLFNNHEIAVSQTGCTLIYHSPGNGISNFQSIKLKGNPQKLLYLQISCSQNLPPPNITGSFLKYNNLNNTWYSAYNNYLNSHWVFEGFNGFWSCNPVSPFAILKDDPKIILKHSSEIVSDCCGPVEVNRITYDSGATFSNAIEIPDYSTFCGMDMDTLRYSEELEYFYAYKIYNSFNNIVNTIIKVVSNYQGLWNDQYTMDTIPSLKSYTEGGFLKINPFKRNYIFTIANNLLLSTSSGTDFFSVNIPPVKKLIFGEYNHRIFGYTNSELYSSSDNGLRWDSVTLPFNFNVIETDPDNGNNLYGGNENGLYFSTDSGLNWSLYNNTFLYSRNVIGISKDSAGFLTVSTDVGVYKVWGQGFVNILQVSNMIPENYSLSQNYPNPFNPVTKIKFDIPSDVRGKTSDVKLVVYDGLGREVQTLVNQKMSPGSYETNFNGANFASGVYFYRLTSRDFSVTRRMILIK